MTFANQVGPGGYHIAGEEYTPPEDLQAAAGTEEVEPAAAAMEEEEQEEEVAAVEQVAPQEHGASSPGEEPRRRIFDLTIIGEGNESRLEESPLPSSQVYLYFNTSVNKLI